MTSKNDGGPAFPVLELDQRSGNVFAQHMGMTLRDWFAGQASEKDIEPYRSFWKDERLVLREREAARYAYAEAMIAERAK